MRKEKSLGIFIISISMVLMVLLATICYASSNPNITSATVSLEKSVSLKLPNGIQTDSKGNFIVVDTDGCRVIKYNNSGKIIFSFGTKGTGKNQFMYPVAVAVDSKDNIYIADTGNSRIVKISPKGEWLNSWSKSNAKKGKLQAPMGIAVDSKGYIYVTDYILHKIVKYNSKCDFVSEITKLTAKGDRLYYPRGISIDKNGKIYIADSGNNRIVVIDKNGNLISVMNKIANYFKLHHPYGVAISADGNFIAVADTDYHRIIIYSNKDKRSYVVGRNEKNKLHLNFPAYICFDLQGNILLSDSFNKRIVKIAIKK